MAIQTMDFSVAARQLIATPTAATQIRLQVVQSTPTVAEAVFGMVSVTRLLAEEAEKRFQHLIGEAKAERERLEEQIKQIDKQIEKLDEQMEKLKRFLDKMDEMIRALDALGTDRNCDPNRAVVSARLTKILQLLSEVESAASELLRYPKYRGHIDWFRRLLEQIPVLFDIPGWR